MTDDDAITPQIKGAPKRRWTVWRILGWIVLTGLMIILIAGAYIWTHRYVFIEDFFKGQLSEQGIDADISVDSIGKTGAVLKDVDLRSGGQSIFSVDELSADYAWRDALNSKVNRLVLTKPKLRLTVNEKGEIIDGWMPAASEDGTGTNLPRDGIFLKDADVTIDSPYGQVNAVGDITVKSRDDITASLTIAKTALVRGDVRALVSGPVAITRRDDMWAVLMKVNAPALSVGERRLDSATITADMRIDLGTDDPVITFIVRSDFEGLDTNRFQTRAGRANWTGRIVLDKAQQSPTAISGDWAADFEGFTVKDAALADELAQRASLFETLSATPIAESFAAGLRGDVRGLFSETDIAGRGGLDWTPRGAELTLSEALTLNGARTKLRIESGSEDALYRYDSAEKRIKIAASVALSGRYPVSVNGLNAALVSQDGISFEGIDSLSGRLERSREWQASADGRDVRLAPASVDMTYIAGANRRLNLTGPIDFDGPVPGGFASGLKGAGRLDVILDNGNLRAGFTPKTGNTIYISRFETLTDWMAEELSFDITATDVPLYRRTPKGADLRATVTNVKGRLREAVTDRNIALDIAAVDAVGMLGDGRQEWDLTASEAEVRTDDFLGPDTIMAAQTATLSAALRADEATQIHLLTGGADLSTPQFVVTQMPLDLRGTTDTFKAHYGDGVVGGALAGRVVMRSNDMLPPLPITGTLSYDKGQIVGKARTVLPKAETANINIDYQFKDGSGGAKVIVPDLEFARGALQPQDFVTSLQGKIADVNGRVSAEIDLAFETGKPLQSSGRVRVNNLDFGTLPGPFSGVSTEIEFDSFFPLTTYGQQTLFVDSFNPGLALIDGVIKYELADNGVSIQSAVWPLAGGTLSLDPTLWIYDAPENRVVVRIDDVSVGAFLGKAGGGNLTATGDVVGVIPVVIAGVNVSIDDGRLAVENGGVIQYRSQQLKSVVDLIPEEYVTLEDYRQFQEVRESQDLGDNIGKDLAFTALRNFEYKSLSAKLNGPLDGEVEVNLQFEGRNPKILAGTRFDFDINVTGELVNLARSLKINGNERVKGYIDLLREDRVSNPSQSPEIDIPLDNGARSSQIQTEKDINP